MKTLGRFAAALVFLILFDVSAFALSIEFTPAQGSPASPKMGDRLRFQSVIRNDGTAPEGGVLAWLSLVRVDKGKEQPMDLEDWSAHKAVVSPELKPGQSQESTWPLRLIQAGSYRVLICAMSRTGGKLTFSPVLNFTVREKPVVDSARVLPVALGLPLLLAGLLVLRMRRIRRDTCRVFPNQKRICYGS